mgnify:CR=1 FL=1
MICFVVTPSISRSGVTITRCCNTGTADCLISSGVTKSRPFIAANALLAFKIAIEALGEAPKYKKGFGYITSVIKPILKAFSQFFKPHQVGMQSP